MNWNIPDLDKDCEEVIFEIIEQDVLTTLNSKELINIDDPWNRDWPTLPNMDIIWPWTSCKDVNFRKLQPPCREGVLGYYIPYHLLLRFYFYENGQPKSHQDVLDFNRTLPKYAMYGIHLCQDTILNYIDRTLNARNLGTEYRNTALALLIQHIIGHEWGHYRAEVNAIQIMKMLSAMGSESELDYFHYMKFKAENRHNNFEEVFADYCGLKMGIFNTRYLNPDNTSSWYKAEMLRLRLSLSIFNNSLNPYGDLRFWLKNPKELEVGIQRLIRSPKIANRSIKLALALKRAESPFVSGLNDVLTNNQLQFIRKRRGSRRLFSSRCPQINFNEIDTFWQYISDDSFMNIPRGPEKNLLEIEDYGHDLVDILNRILPDIYKKNTYKLPLRTFPDLLKIGPVLVD